VDESLCQEATAEGAEIEIASLLAEARDQTVERLPRPKAQ